ncbi:glycoside hydrolase family 97 protein [Fulvivirga ligni]|uniref:glycoside hydrolase family 97 protein n=1 Tax=Fulvivirga ligni TaxID=2904246 RepID=UPI001F312806|nr:glycoside hydrolase family 97 protein [Fulvivirga ligni]UII19620.1 glycoside hydrolase family 97 protein [Fulvivirga ligni]
MNQSTRHLFTIVVLFLSFQSLSAKDKPVTVKSPDSKLAVSITVGDKINYTISANGKNLLTDCHLGIAIGGPEMKKPALKKTKTTSGKEELHPYVSLKYNTVKSEYNGVELSLGNGYAVEFRVFNDGVAYRLITSEKGDMEVYNEDFTIGFPEDYLLHLQQPGGFKTSCEEPYSHVESSQWKASDRMSSLPVLIDTKDKYKILISESDLSDYPAMFLKSNEGNTVKAVFPKAPLEFGPDGDRSLKITKEADYIAKTKGSRTLPWRYFVITDDKGLMENTMTLKLAAKSRIDDPSWIKPGQVSWEWWNGAAPYGPDVNFVSGQNQDTYKYYIDFASKYGISYIILDEGWAKSTTDPFTASSQVDVKELVEYGKQKNVGIILWLTWLSVENHMDVFKAYKDWGVKGVKIDFMDRSDQWMVDYYERVVKEAAKHQLIVDFHGSFKPAGLEYKYPNLISYEGVRGMEQMGGCTPDNSIYFPFIRNAVGPMDYTPGAMISMQPNVYRSERPNSASIGTRAYQMALFVVFESGVQMLADNPTMYYKNPDCTEFITSVPVTWDETQALEAEVGQLAVVAKRKGEKWFVGGITNGAQDAREVTLNFDFLDKNKTYTMTYFEDGINAGRQAMDYRKKTKQVKNGDKITIKMVRNGGWVARLE